MKSNWFVAMMQAAVVWLGLSAAAQAMTINPGDSVTLDTTQDYTTAQIFKPKASGAERPIPAGGNFSDTYFFNAGATLMSYFPQVLPTVPANGRGIDNFTLTFYDMTAGGGVVATLLITNATGAATAAAGVDHYLTMVVGNVYKLVVSGHLHSKGGQYNLDISAVPVPPAMILFISGLAGLGALSRRKRAKVAA